MSMMSRAAVYRIFRRPGDPAARVRPVVIAMVLVAVAVVSLGVLRVTRQHEVLSLGYRLSRATERVQTLQEQRRQLELERATLAAPDRIRRLATELGMAPVAADHIRIVARHPKVVSRE
jgi:cell division protein FtsL